MRGMMQNQYLSRYIADAGWSEFVRMLSYKTEWYGSRLIKAPRFYPSSKMCSACGAIKSSLNLSERKFACQGCGAVIDRDKNAALNLEHFFTGSSPESYACGDTSGGGILRNRESTSHVSQKQEADTRYSHKVSG